MLLKKLFSRKDGGKKKRIIYRNYGTFRVPDEIYFIPYTGKAKIIFDLTKVLQSRRIGANTLPEE